MPRFLKGSKEAKEWSAMMRAKRGKGLVQGQSVGVHTNTQGGTIQTNVFAEFLKDWAKEHKTTYSQAIQSKVAKKDFEKFKKTLPPQKSFVPDKPNITFSVQPTTAMVENYNEIADEQPPIEVGAFDEQEVQQEIAEDEVGMSAPLPLTIQNIEEQYPLFKEMFDNSSKRGRNFYYEMSDMNDFQKYYQNNPEANEALKQYTALQKQRAADMPSDFVWTAEDEARRDARMVARAEAIKREAKSRPKRRNDDVYVEELIDEGDEIEPFEERRIRENISVVNGVSVIPLSIVEETGLPIYTSKSHNKLYTQFEGKSIWIDDAGIKGKGFLFGGKMKVSDIKGLLEKSYTDSTSDYGNYKIDKELSNPYAQVYYDAENDHPVVVHRGTADLADWGTNASLLFGYRGKRYNTAKKVQQSAERKYGAKNLTTLAHSQSGRWAEELGQNGKEIITLNKATTPLDRLRKVSDKEYDIRTEKDPVSVISKSKNAIVIPSTTNNPLTEHSLNVLDRLDPNMEIGRGLGFNVMVGGKVANPDLYEKAKATADAKYKKHSAYKSGFIQKEYKRLGGTYIEDGKEKPLGRWFEEEWKDVGGKEYPVYRPTKKVSKKTPLTPDEIDPANLAKQIKRKQKIKGKENLPPFVEGSGVEDTIDFEDIKWGTLTAQMEAYNRQHSKKVKDLEEFAKMILADPSKYQKKTIKRARFYLNVLLPKKKK